MNRSLISSGVAFLIVALDVLGAYGLLSFARPILPVAGLMAVLCINDGRMPALGLRSRPTQGWWHWCLVALAFGLVISVLVVICAGLWWALGRPIPIPRTDPAHVLYSFYWMCVYAPVSEEILYRSLLTVSVAPVFGRTATILISGALFALIHVLQVNPGPDNLVAGFLLAWAFLKSETILVPIAMHSAGNLIALLVHMTAWYSFGPPLISP
jgi:membrane protease YdiL (CAAX protease family)